jgi:hypothetical protein
MTKALEKGIITEIVWIPGHTDIKHNDKVDEEAKKAAKSEGRNDAIPRASFPPLKSARIQLVKLSTNADWRTTWKQNRAAKLLHKITTKRNVHQSDKIYKSIARRNDVAQIARLRTGHCSLNQYLHRFGIEESPTCECNSEVIETVDHYLINCPKYDRQRHKLIKNVGIGGMWVEKLLGNTSSVKHTLEYIKDTKRFNF